MKSKNAKAGHVFCGTHGFIPEDQIERKVLHHIREGYIQNVATGAREPRINSTRHTEYFHKGLLVRRDVHIGATPSAPQVGHDEVGGNELERRIARLFERDEPLALAYSGAGALLAPNPFDEALAEIRRGLAILAGITTALLTSLKVELAKAIHDFSNGGDTFKLALFKAQALLTGTYDAGTTGYAQMTGNGDELANGNGYTTGGVAIAMNTPGSTGTTAFWGPSASSQWTNSTFTTRGAMAYNSSKANRGWFVYDFGADEPVVAGTLTVNYPVNAAGTAMTRL